MYLSVPVLKKCPHSLYYMLGHLPADPLSDLSIARTFSLIYSSDVSNALPQNIFPCHPACHLNRVASFLVRCLHKSHSSKVLTLGALPHQGESSAYEDGSCWEPVGRDATLVKQDPCGQVLCFSSRDCVYIWVASLPRCTFKACKHPLNACYVPGQG